MDLRASKRRRINDSGIGQSISSDNEQESSQISLELSTRYQINNSQASMFNTLNFQFIQIFMFFYSILANVDEVGEEDANFSDNQEDNDVSDNSEDSDEDSEIDDEEDDVDEDNDDEDQQNDPNNNIWSDECPELLPLAFEGDVGPTFDRLRTPLEYFKKFFTEDLFNLLLNETVRYARRNKPNFMLNATEIWGFLGVTMIMSMIHVPFIEDYWSHENWFGQKQVKDVFVRKRYREILSALHLIDKDSPTCNRNSPEYDRLHNIRPIIRILKHNFRENFSLGCELSFDEFMIKYKGNYLIKL